MVYRLGQEEEDEYKSQPSKGRLEPEYVPPALERDDDTSDEWSKGRANKGTAQEPAQRRCSLSLKPILA